MNVASSRPKPKTNANLSSAAAIVRQSLVQFIACRKIPFPQAMSGVQGECGWKVGCSPDTNPTPFRNRSFSITCTQICFKSTKNFLCQNIEKVTNNMACCANCAIKCKLCKQGHKSWKIPVIRHAGQTVQINASCASRAVQAGKSVQGVNMASNASCAIMQA